MSNVNPRKIDLTQPIDPKNPQPFWRGDFIFEVNGGETSYREPDRPTKQMVAYPNRIGVYMSKRKAQELIQILSRQLDDDEEECAIEFFGELILDNEEEGR